MPITITITADSVAEFQQHVKDFARSWNQLQDTPKVGPQLIVAEKPQEQLSVNSKSEQANSEVVGEQPSAPKKRGRKAKESEAVEVNEPQAAEVANENQQIQSSEPAAVSDPLAPQSSEETHQEQAPSSAPALPTKEAAVEALKKVSEHFGKEENGKGILLCRDILAKFDARKISELAEDKRGAMIELCHKVIATGRIE